MSYLYADRYTARDYFKLLKNSVRGKNCFCVRIDSGADYPFTAIGVLEWGDGVLVEVEPNDLRVERVYFEDLDSLEFEFTPGLNEAPGYYRPIRKEKSVSTLDPTEFQGHYIENTFDHLQETSVLYDEQFYTVLGMRTNLVRPGNYILYLMRRSLATVRKVEITPNQRFIYQKNSNSWLVDPVDALYTDFTDVKDQLRADGVRKVVVAGVEKSLKRVSEISSGILHLVFEWEGETEHFYSTKNTCLRVREGKIATEYLLDHVNRMYV